MKRNEAIDRALKQKKQDPNSFSRETEIDVKTIKRWLNDNSVKIRQANQDIPHEHLGLPYEILNDREYIPSMIPVYNPGIGYIDDEILKEHRKNITDARIKELKRIYSTDSWNINWTQNDENLSTVGTVSYKQYGPFKFGKKEKRFPSPTEKYFNRKRLLTKEYEGIEDKWLILDYLDNAEPFADSDDLYELRRALYKDYDIRRVYSTVIDNIYFDLLPAKFIRRFFSILQFYMRHTALASKKSLSRHAFEIKFRQILDYVWNKRNEQLLPLYLRDEDEEDIRDGYLDYGYWLISSSEISISITDIANVISDLWDDIKYLKATKELLKIVIGSFDESINSSITTEDLYRITVYAVYIYTSYTPEEIMAHEEEDI